MPKLTLWAAGLFVLYGGLFLHPDVARSEEHPRVVAVNYALSYFAERLGPDEIEVDFPVPDGIDPSFWRPGIADISAIQSADLILLNGAGFSTWTTKASLPRSRIVDTSRGFSDHFIQTETVTHSHGADGEHSHTGLASYTWLDQDLAILQAEAVAAALETRGLVDADLLASRLKGLIGDLQALDDAATDLANIAQSWVLIATHPRYQYLAEAYGLNIRYLEWEAGSAPSEGQLAELRDLVAKTGAKVLLWEDNPPPNARADVRALGLAEMVFPTLAQRVEEDYVEQFGRSIDELSSLLRGVIQ